MTYTAVDIPFFTGQDESFDKKLLPVGPLRRVENAFQERTGRMVEKLGQSSRPTIDANEGVISTRRVKNVLPNDYVTVEINGGVKTVGYPANGVSKLLEGSGSSAYGYEDTLRAVAVVGGSVTYCPSVGVTSTHIIFAYCSGSNQDEGDAFHVDVYARDTLKLVRRQTLPGNAGQIKVSADLRADVPSSFAIMTKENQGTVIERYFFSSSLADWPDATTANRLINIEPNSTFDVSDCTSEESANIFWVVWYTSTSEVSFSFAHQRSGEMVRVGTGGNIPSSDTPERFNWILSSITAISSQIAWTSHVYSSEEQRDGNSQVYLTERLAVLTGPVNAPPQTISGREGVPCMSVRGDEATVAQGDFVRTYAESLDSLAEVTESFSANNCFPLGSPIISEDTTLSAEGLGDTVVGERHREDRSVRTYFRGTVSIINPGVDDKYGSPSGILLRAGGSDESRTRVGFGVDEDAPEPASQDGSTGMNRWTPAKVVSWEEDGVGQTLICVEQRLPQGFGQIEGRVNNYPLWTTEATLRVLDNKHTRNNIFGASWDQRNVMTSGAGVAAINDPLMHFGGFTGTPKMLVQAFTGETDMEDGDYVYICVLEYIDPSGRLWRSPPSDPVFVTLPDGSHLRVSASVCAGSPAGARKVIYRSKVGGSIPFRLGSFDYDEAVLGSTFVDDTVDDDLSPETIYTLGLVLPNDPPPLGRFITRTRNRFWVGRQEFPARVQSSKFLRPTEGVHWSNADQFAVDIPEAVTGMASMDDTLIVFSENNIYLVHGDGPTDQGSGGYSSPQTIPSEGGCTQARGIITGEKGIYFISRRGIELLNRGFSAPVFVGDPVRDITEEFPFCLGVVILQSAQQIRWLMNTDEAGDGGTSVVLVLDTRVNAWSVFRYGVNPTMMGTATAQLAQHPPDGTTFYRQTLGQSTRENTVRNDPEETRRMVWETGELRPAGMIAGAYGRRLHILGTYGTNVDVTIEMAFDDAKDFHPTFVKTWQLRAVDYEEGDPVQLELTLPVQKFSSCRFRLSADRQTTGNNSFQAHGLTVFFDTEGEGPRVGARSKG